MSKRKQERLIVRLAWKEEGGGGGRWRGKGGGRSTAVPFLFMADFMCYLVSLLRG